MRLLRRCLQAKERRGEARSSPGRWTTRGSWSRSARTWRTGYFNSISAREPWPRITVRNDRYEIVDCKVWLLTPPPPPPLLHRSAVLSASSAPSFTASNSMMLRAKEQSARHEDDKQRTERREIWTGHVSSGTCVLIFSMCVQFSLYLIEISRNVWCI